MSDGAGQRPELGAGSDLLSRLLEFCSVLRTRGLGVTPGRTIDAVRSLTFVHITDREEFRLALRVNLASSREEEDIFDCLFESFWGKLPGRAVASERLVPDSRPQDSSRGRVQTVLQGEGVRGRYGTQERLGLRDLGDFWPGGSRELERAVRDFAQRIATRPSRRLRAARRGLRIDLRRSLRRNARNGLELVEILRSCRKVRKTRLVLLCDVSGSMDAYTPFLLQLLLGLKKGLPRSRMGVFSTRMTEITLALRQRSVDDTLREVSVLAGHWSGGTDIGRALASLNRTMVTPGSSRSTVCVIVSDGYDQGDSGIVRREMEALRRRSRKIVWINPLLGTAGYQPLARGMKAALPYLDYFLPAHDIVSLRNLVRTLGNV